MPRTLTHGSSDHGLCPKQWIWPGSGAPHSSHAAGAFSATPPMAELGFELVSSFLLVSSWKSANDGSDIWLLVTRLGDPYRVLILGSLLGITGILGIETA